MRRLPLLRQEILCAMTSASLLSGSTAAFAATTPQSDLGNEVTARTRVSNSYGKLPISFEPNAGQASKEAQFLAHGPGYMLFLEPSEMVLALHTLAADSKKPDFAGRTRGPWVPTAAEKNSAMVWLKLAGSNRAATANGVDLLPGKSNYFPGDDPAKWRTDIPTYARVLYRDVYPGIDLAYYGNQDGELEHDFVVAPGADPKQIRLTLSDGRGMVRAKKGGLRLRTQAGEVEMKEPVAYQMIDGQRRNVDVAYDVSGGGNIEFRLRNYDRSSALVIDPVLEYTAVFGGSNNDTFSGMVMDSSQNIYITGATLSTDFPLANAFQSTWMATGTSSAATAGFVTKINASGTAILSSTYLGGPNVFPTAIAVDRSGDMIVGGGTGPGFPVKNAYQPNYSNHPNSDAFLTMLSPAGNSLEWSTYLGGGQDSYISAIALDTSGNVYVDGYTYGSFPAWYSFQSILQPGLWLAKFNPSGSPQYITVYSNAVAPSPNSSLAVDSAGAAYVVGSGTWDVSPLGPSTTTGAFRTACPTSANLCAWAAKFGPSGTNVEYATYLGANGSGIGNASAIALDSDNNAYIGGDTGPGLPVWSTGFQRTYGGNTDAFVVKLNATGSNLIWSTYLGGNDIDYLYGLAIDQHRTVYVSGMTCSSNFPVKAPIQNYPNRCGSFVTTLSPSLSSIAYYSTYLATPIPYGIAVDPALDVYLAGSGTGVQPTPGALSTGSTKSGTKIFLEKLTIMDDMSVSLSASPSPVVHGGLLIYTITATSKGPDFGTNVRISDTLPAGTTFVSYGAGGGSCTAPAVGGTGTLNCALVQLNAGATWMVTLTVQVNAASGATLSNMAATMSNMQDFNIANNSATISTKVN